MTPQRFLRAAFALAIVSLLPACGGGGATAGGGIGGTGKPGIEIGTIEALDDLVVGGTTFDTTQAQVRIDGLDAQVADLEVGMVALVAGEIANGTGTADLVEVEEVLKGPLEDKPAADTLTVLSQTVQTDARTTFGPGIAPASTDGLQVGDLLEVHGFVRADGVIHATRIEREGALGEFRVTGFVGSVDTVEQTFTIGGLTVDYAQADTTDLPGGVPAVGLLVQARGLNALGSLGELVATEIRTEDDLAGEVDNDATGIEGFISAIRSPTEFAVGPIVVQINGATRFEGGTAADLAVGVFVEVEGALVSGLLVAREVEFEDAVRIESDVDAVVDGMITLRGFPSVTIATDALTAFEGDAAGLGDLAPGDHVEVRGRVSGASAVVATRIKEDGPRTDVRLEGPVDAVPAPADPSFAILGIVIDTTGLPDGAFRDGEDAAIGRAAFFAALAPGGFAEAKGDLSGSTPIWDEVGLED